MEKLRPLIAEFIGTFTLVFIGSGAICYDAVLRVMQQAAHEPQTGIGLLAIAVAHGLALGLMISNFGHISGGHFNPAVSFGFFVTKLFDLVKMLSYWVAQLLGAVVAAVLLLGIFKSAGRFTHIGLPSFDSLVPPHIGPR